MLTSHTLAAHVSGMTLSIMSDVEHFPSHVCTQQPTLDAAGAPGMSQAMATSTGHTTSRVPSAATPAATAASAARSARRPAADIRPSRRDLKRGRDSSTVASPAGPDGTDGCERGSVIAALPVALLLPLPDISAGPLLA